MRRLPTLPACLLCAVIGVIAPPADAATIGSKTPITITGAEATRLLNDLGLPAGSCTDKRRFDVVGSITLRPGYSGTVGEFPTPSGLRLRIDSAVSQIFDAEQFAGAIGLTTKGIFNWYTMYGVNHGLSGETYWVYPNPGKLPIPRYADPNILVKVEVNRQGSIAQSANAFYGVRGCLVDMV